VVAGEVSQFESDLSVAEISGENATENLELVDANLEPLGCDIRDGDVLGSFSSPTVEDNYSNFGLRFKNRQRYWPIKN
jgi:hypothetical protein